jgi:hypothetical protein
VVRHPHGRGKAAPTPARASIRAVSVWNCSTAGLGSALVPPWTYEVFQVNAAASWALPHVAEPAKYRSGRSIWLGSLRSSSASSRRTDRP